MGRMPQVDSKKNLMPTRDPLTQAQLSILSVLNKKNHSNELFDASKKAIPVKGLVTVGEICVVRGEARCKRTLVHLLIMFLETL